MRLIDVDAITDDEIISYLGIRYASCKKDIRDMLDELPTLDEKEIIRKPFERAMERLEECFERYEDVEYYARLEESEETLDSEYAHGKKDGINEAIEIVKEECGISE